jgi:Plant transposon protein
MMSLADAEEQISEMATALCVLVCVLRKLGPLPKQQLFLLSYILVTCVAAVAEVIDETQRVEENRMCRLMITTCAVFEDNYNNSNRKRSRMSATEFNERERDGKRIRVCLHNHARAKEAVRQDWLTADCIFSDRHFERVFRLTRGIVERLIQACGNYEPKFFTTRKNCAGKEPISIEVKVLGVLKCVAFGCSGVAFMDYHQMAPGTFTEGLKALFRALKKATDLKDHYMRSPSPSDIKRITEQHQRVHGVPGMLGCLDCLHVYWKNCPVAWQGQFKNGRYKQASVVTEGLVDHNLWFWHVSVGHAGTNSDTNIWDVSPLLQSLLSDEWSRTCDFEFVLDGKAFDKVWILVDGIYPPISRFVKTVSHPVDAVAKMFAEWQESTRKDVERAFGVLTRKFQFLTKPVEYWELEDVKRIIFGCVMMHNMMVEVRIDRDEAEDAGMYQVNARGDFPGHQLMERTNVLDGHVREAWGYNPHSDTVQDHVSLAMKRWNGLYNDASHSRLQTAMMNHIAASFVRHNKQQRKNGK